MERRQMGQPGGRRHVWVEPPGMRFMAAGLVLDWRQGPEQWEALITYVAPEALLVETRWLPHDHSRIRVRPGDPPIYGAQPEVRCPACGHVLIDQ